VGDPTDLPLASDDPDILRWAEREGFVLVTFDQWQSKAIELLTDERVKEDCRSRLKLYQEKKPYRLTQR